jgi:ubiquinone/menaquinone biosynthesis C-methylase UbiE
MNRPKVLDICCGTGSVILSFAEQIDDILAIGYDFSVGMLQKAKEKHFSDKVIFIKGDAANLPFLDDIFDIVCCSHALYELKGKDRRKALLEIKRVVSLNGKVLIMEHEVPKKRLIKLLFNLRMLMLGPTDAREFFEQGIYPYKEIFSNVDVSHTKSGKSKLITCRKF